MPQRMLHILDFLQHLLTIKPPFMCEYWWFKSSLWLCVTTCLWKPFHGFVTSQCNDRSRYRFSVYILAFVPHLYKNINSSRTMRLLHFTFQWLLGMHLKIKLLCRAMILSACADMVSRLVAILCFGITNDIPFVSPPHVTKG